MADDKHVLALHRSEPDWPTSERQETQTHNDFEEKQLVSKVQRNLPFVSDLCLCLTVGVGGDKKTSSYM